MSERHSLTFRVYGEPKGRLHTRARAITRTRCPGCKSEHAIAVDKRRPNLRRCGNCGRVYQRVLTVSAPEGSPEQASWTQAVRDAAAQAAREQGWEKPEVGAVSLTVEFVMPRPQAFTWKTAHAEPHHWRKPDRKNLESALEDALRGVLWRDDSQICQGPISKRYARPGEQCGALVTVAYLGEWRQELAGVAAEQGPRLW